MVNNRKTAYRIAIIVCIITLIILPSTYALFKNKVSTRGKVSLASWNVSLNQEGESGNLTIVPETKNDSYVINVTSNAEVDVKYSIIIRNLPSGVEVSIDNGTFYPQVNDVISFADVGTILYTDTQKTKTHTLTFRAVSGATVVANQSINIDVIVRQIV